MFSTFQMDLLLGVHWLKGIQCKRDFFSFLHIFKSHSSRRVGFTDSSVYVQRKSSSKYRHFLFVCFYCPSLFRSLRRPLNTVWLYTLSVMVPFRKMSYNIQKRFWNFHSFSERKLQCGQTILHQERVIFITMFILFQESFQESNNAHKSIKIHTKNALQTNKQVPSPKLQT